MNAANQSFMCFLISPLWLRWSLSVVLVGVVPLIIANLIGIPMNDGQRRSNWQHGWPVRYCYRPPYLRIMDLSGPPISDARIDALLGVSSRWPFDHAGVMRRYRQLWFIGVVVVALTIGLGVAMRRSSLVRRGVPLVSLRTLFIFTALTAFTATMQFRWQLWGWECWFALPAMTGGICGYCDLAGDLGRRISDWRCEALTTRSTPAISEDAH